jgi:hypothetical protein
MCRLHDAFFAAAQEAGMTANPDFNEWNRAQVSWWLHASLQHYSSSNTQLSMWRSVMHSKH